MPAASVPGWAAPHSFTGRSRRPYGETALPPLLRTLGDGHEATALEIIRHPSVVRAFLRSRTIEVSLVEVQESPLHLAAKRGLPRAVPALLAKGADLCLRTLAGHTPLYCAPAAHVPRLVRADNGPRDGGGRACLPAGGAPVDSHVHGRCVCGCVSVCVCERERGWRFGAGGFWYQCESCYHVHTTTPTAGRRVTSPKTRGPMGLQYISCHNVKAMVGELLGRKRAEIRREQEREQQQAEQAQERER